MENTGLLPWAVSTIPPCMPGSTSSPLRWKSLYTFTTTDQVLGEFVRCVEQNKERFIDKTFHSLDILNNLQ